MIGKSRGVQQSSSNSGGLARSLAIELPGWRGKIRVNESGVRRRTLPSNNWNEGDGRGGDLGDVERARLLDGRAQADADGMLELPEGRRHEDLERVGVGQVDVVHRELKLDQRCTLRGGKKNVGSPITPPSLVRVV